jgi:hypothetical protein
MTLIFSLIIVVNSELENDTNCEIQTANGF